jgi:ligand-binding sensor domain-containing protein
MYFGNSSGAILEYDGVTWKKIFIPSSVVRSLVEDETGKIWVGLSENFGYLSPDAAGTLHYVSLLDKVPAEDRTFTDVWQTLVTREGVFFRSYEKLFRWDGQRMKVWSHQPKARFQALSAVRGHIYTAQGGSAGLQEIVGDELRDVPGGDAYANSGKLFLHPYDADRILISQRDQLLTLYDGKQAVPFPTEADEYLTTHKPYTSTLLADGSFCITTLNGGAVIIGRDGKLRQIIDEGAGLLGSNTLSAYQDREGALWLGLDAGVARVEIDSPISIFTLEGTFDVARYKGSIYVSSGGGKAAVQRIVFDPKTGHPSLVPLRGSTQAFTLTVFKDPAGKTSDQLLAATSEGVMKVEGGHPCPCHARPIRPQ